MTGRLLLADEMGTGKTLQAIAIAQCYRAEWHVELARADPLCLCEAWT